MLAANSSLTTLMLAKAPDSSRYAYVSDPAPEASMNLFNCLGAAALAQGLAGTQFPRFTGTKVQILTQKASQPTARCAF
jgi:hypothetical protein